MIVQKAFQIVFQLLIRPKDCLLYAPCGLLDEPLLPLDVGQVVEGVRVRGGQSQGRVVAVLRLRDQALLLESDC